MPSTGLMALGGLGEALSKGVDSYLKVKGMQNEEKARQQQLGLLAARENMELNPETGEYGLSAYGQQVRENAAAKDAAELAHLEAQTGLLNAKSRAASSKGGMLKPSKGQEALDKRYGMEYAKRLAEGGYASQTKNLKQLEDVIGRLGKTDRATGPMVGLLPKAVRDVAVPESGAIQDDVEEVIQRNLRQILGAQFTEKEGKALIARAYNPRQSEATNIKRLNRLAVQMKQALDVQQEADNYFDREGTLQGFKGQLFQSPDAFTFEDETEEKQAPAWDAAKEKKLQELRAKAAKAKQK